MTERDHPSVKDLIERAASDQRWVCGSCGKYTNLGAHRYSLSDTSCIFHAVLCKAERRDGKWIAAATNEPVADA